MYLISQMALYLFASFLLGAGLGYALWRSLGEREVLARFQAAELRLAAQLARFESQAATSARHSEDASRAASAEAAWHDISRRELHEFEVKQAQMLKEAEDAAIRKAEAAAEKRFADLARKIGYDPAAAAEHLNAPEAPEKRVTPAVISLPEAREQAAAAADAKRG